MSVSDSIFILKFPIDRVRTPFLSQNSNFIEVHLSPKHNFTRISQLNQSPVSPWAKFADDKWMINKIPIKPFEQTVSAKKSFNSRKIASICVLNSSRNRIRKKNSKHLIEFIGANIYLFQQMATNCISIKMLTSIRISNYMLCALKLLAKMSRYHDIRY